MLVRVSIAAIFILPSVVIASLSVSPATLTTTLGQVTGIRKVSGNKMVEVFYSIPFAKPPVGELRFRPPLPADPWLNVVDGTQKPKSCWQLIDTSFERFPGVEMWNPNTPRSEDCLYLNVWRPVCTGISSENKPKSILVWIYGGGFTAGTTTLDLYDGTQLSALNDVIVVSIAYRLGSLGFLSLNSPEAPGNAGLMDQALGLKWVRDNAENLGGSKNAITIFGESAGAVSVGYHLLSPISKNLFNYAILQSATPLAGWAIHDQDTARNISLHFASAISCPSNNINASINCLRTLDPQLLCEKQSEINAHFPPVIDGVFIPDHPQKMAERGEIKNTSILLGVNRNEGIYFNIYDFKDNLPLQGNGQINNSQFDYILLKYLNNDKRVSAIIKEEYMRDKNLSFTDLLDAITGDIYFKCPVVNFANLASQKGGSVFLYEFEHRVSTNPWPKWTGVAHGYEIELVFGLPLAPGSVYTEEEKALSIQIMKYWTNFAKTGNPNYNQTNQWPEYTAATKEYAVMELDGLKVGHGLRESQCSFLANTTNPTQIPELPVVIVPTVEINTVSVDDEGLRRRDVVSAFGHNPSFQI